MSKELEKSIKHVFDRAKEMGDWYEDESPHITKKLNEDIEVVKKALNELEDTKHNYNALKEFYDNAVAYGVKIQKELNELKKRNEPIKPIIIIELEQVRPFKQTYKTAMCGNCKNQLSYTDKPRYCPDCGQALDWSDEE